ncbi:hypothetical protein NADFUDRAFT_83648 [Nadsonia fulvescens var. elongata DSM 6958]|uniref:Large ribosomal subunit protein mL54 n=1 Tax=Nadsonia fulvescens var. elongata DSM 6958 TaxID=857566 RepID=A0A1E3PIT8_9ASCO|nr:hypothetical protein NADFUDRAFT_83648 [Nadsonia fulvescens var. elongata DSM 6958]
MFSNIFRRVNSPSFLRLPTVGLRLNSTSAAKIISSCPEGTVLKGINIRKSGKDPIALKDEEYPEWLWTVLDANSVASNPMNSSRKVMRKANREQIKFNNFVSKMG